jgi:hypothetical protein
MTFVANFSLALRTSLFVGSVFVYRRTCVKQNEETSYIWPKVYLKRLTQSDYWVEVLFAILVKPQRNLCNWNFCS